jgi:hypothetical protein
MFVKEDYRTREVSGGDEDSMGWYVHRHSLWIVKCDITSDRHLLVLLNSWSRRPISKWQFSIIRIAPFSAEILLSRPIFPTLGIKTIALTVTQVRARIGPMIQKCCQDITRATLSLKIPTLHVAGIPFCRQEFQPLVVPKETTNGDS